MTFCVFLIGHKTYRVVENAQVLAPSVPGYTNYEAISFCCRVKNSLFAVPAPSIFIQSCVSGFIAQPDLKTTSMQPLE